jgi:hypothetical protein
MRRESYNDVLALIAVSRERSLAQPHVELLFLAVTTLAARFRGLLPVERIPAVADRCPMSFARRKAVVPLWQSNVGWCPAYADQFLQAKSSRQHSEPPPPLAIRYA